MGIWPTDGFEWVGIRSLRQRPKNLSFLSRWTIYSGCLRNPAPVDRSFIPLFIGFLPSKVAQDFATIHSILRGCGNFDPYLSGLWSHSKLPGWFVVTSLCSFAKSNGKLSKAVALFESSRDYLLNEWIISKAGRDCGLQSARSWIVSNNIQKEMASNNLVNKRDATWGKTNRSWCRFWKGNNAEKVSMETCDFSWWKSMKIPWKSQGQA